jgi:hypothetical protein
MKSIFTQYGVLASVSSATFEWVFYATSSSSDTYLYFDYFEGASDDLADMNETITNAYDPKDYVGDFVVFFCTSDTTYYFFEAVQTS